MTTNAIHIILDNVAGTGLTGVDADIVIASSFAAQAVPEPATAVIGAGALSFLLFLRRRRA